MGPYHPTPSHPDRRHEPYLPHNTAFDKQLMQAVRLVCGCSVVVVSHPSCRAVWEQCQLSQGSGVPKFDGIPISQLRRVST